MRHRRKPRPPPAITPVEGYCESLDSITTRKPDWIPSKTVNILLQAGAHPHPDLPGVPLVPDLAKSPEDRIAIEFLYAGQGIGRPFLAPPGVPAEQAKMLRAAFDATMRDPGFIAETQLRKVEPGARKRRISRKADQEDLCDAKADCRSHRGSDQIAAGLASRPTRPQEAACAHDIL